MTLARTISAVFLLTLVAAAQDKPNFSGNWRLDSEKSDFGLETGPSGRVDQIEQNGTVFRLTSIQQRFKVVTFARWDCQIDGGCALEARQFKVDAKAVWDGPVLRLLSYGTYAGSEVFISERWTLSPDGRSLSIARRMSNDAGETRQTIVMQKQ
jgi:hypothetical protein